MSEKVLMVLGSVLLVVIMAFLISIFCLGFYCRKHAMEWLRENGRYYTLNSASTFWGFCVLLTPTNIAAMIPFIINKQIYGILICCAIELVFVLTGFFIVRKIAKKKPEKGVWKILLYMAGTVWGYAINAALVLVGKGIDMAAEIENQRQARYESVETYCRNNGINPKKISHDGYSYIDNDGVRHEVDFY